MEKVVKVVVFSTDGTVFNDTYREFFPTHPPARTFIGVRPWILDFGTEIECVTLA